MIRITPAISLSEEEIHLDFVRSSGAGGQNVNKVSSAVQLRFDVRNSPSLSPDIKTRLARLAGKRLTVDGILILKSQSHRTQERNRAEALQRLTELIEQAAIAPVSRRATKPTKGSQTRRLESKRIHSQTKRLRRDTSHEE
ncbi:MAG TPA: alternative ribosome rescue aminoacyl-tRNA hydrolase ArfB [Abditibacteriaceae bacterium]|jgi:ribosome-associated protein